MKKLLAILLLAGCVQGAAAQNNGNEKTLFEEVTGIKKLLIQSIMSLYS